MSSGDKRGGLEDRIYLAAVLQHLPGPCKTRRNHERVSSAEAVALTTFAFDDDPAGSHDTQLILRVADAPLAARGRPTSGKKLLCCVVEIVVNARERMTADQPLGIQLDLLRFDRTLQYDYGFAHRNHRSTEHPRN